MTDTTLYDVRETDRQFYLDAFVQSPQSTPVAPINFRRRFILNILIFNYGTFILDAHIITVSERLAYESDSILYLEAGADLVNIVPSSSQLNSLWRSLLFLMT